MPNQEKLPSAWVYARILGDCAATRASYDACCRQAGDDGCTVVGGSIDYKGHGPLRDGYQSMLRGIRDGKVNCVYVSRMRQISGKEWYLYAFFKCAMKHHVKVRTLEYSLPDRLQQYRLGSSNTDWEKESKHTRDAPALRCRGEVEILLQRKRR